MAGTEADVNTAVVDLVDALIEYAGADVRSITVHIQASGEYPWSYIDPDETLPVAGMATAPEA